MNAQRMTSQELIAARERHGLTQGQLAELLGLHVNIVASWEARKAPPLWLTMWFIGFEYVRAVTRAAE